MRIKLNDKPYEVTPGTNLFSFIEEEIGIQQEGIAVAINYQVIPKSQWKDTLLTDGLELMLIQAVSGG